MKVLLSFVGNRDPYDESRGEVGPILSLLQDRAFDSVYLFCTGPNHFERAKTVESLADEAGVHAKFHFVSLDLVSVVDYEEIFSKLKASVDTIFQSIGGMQISAYILLDPGTPQMQTCWFLLANSGYITAELLQGVPPRFAGGAYKVRTISLKKSVFPSIRFDNDQSPLKDRVWFTTAADPKIVGESPKFLEAIDRARQAAKYDISVLILGETGTGKEVFARLIHNASGRSSGPFLPINCASINATLAESELFGCKKGAFTGADRDRIGQIRSADGGTIFLDEIGDLPIDIQPKLLRVLENGMVLPVGFDSEIRVDVRILAATNRRLEELVDAGTFRRDLYERLAQLTVHIPPLSERKEDIPLLIRAFVGDWNATYDEKKGLSEETISYFIRYPWPGNVRGLKNAVTTMCAIGRSNAIGPDLLPPSMVAYFGSDETNEDFGISIPDDGMNLKALLNRLEQEYYEEALRRSEGNREQAARLLGVNGAAFRKALRERFDIAQTDN